MNEMCKECDRENVVLNDNRLCDRCEKKEMTDRIEKLEKKMVELFQLNSVLPNQLEQFEEEEIGDYDYNWPDEDEHDFSEPDYGRWD